MLSDACKLLRSGEGLMLSDACKLLRSGEDLSRDLLFWE